MCGLLIVKTFFLFSFWEMVKNIHRGGLVNPHLGITSESLSEVLGANKKQPLLGVWTVSNLCRPYNTL